MKIAGIVLLILQAIGIAGSIINGQIADLFSNFSIYALAENIGFFLPCIIGIILLVISAKKSKKNKNDKK